MARKINQQTVVDPYKAYSRIWIFRTQELMDLWINEMQGQISDGMWENSRGTDWLWEGYDIYTLGEETKLMTLGTSPFGLCSYKKPKMTYPLTRSLVDVVGDRAMEENGFSSLKELKEAWAEINTAIANACTDFCGDVYRLYVKQPRELAEKKRKDLLQCSFKYVEENLSDLITVSTMFSGNPYLGSLTKNIQFGMNRDNGKIKIQSYKGRFEAEVEPEKVRETVKFIQEVLWR